MAGYLVCGLSYKTDFYSTYRSKALCGIMHSTGPWRTHQPLLGVRGPVDDVEPVPKAYKETKAPVVA